MRQFLVVLAMLFLNSCGVSETSKIKNTSTEINEDDYSFVGCVPSFSECRYSCPSTNNGFYAIEDNDKCEFSESSFSKIACYCKKEND